MIEIDGTSRPEAVKQVRAVLGCGLREAFDFVMGCDSPAAAVAEAQKLKDEGKNTSYQTIEERVREVVRKAFEEVRAGHNASITYNKAFQDISYGILNMRYVPSGQEDKGDDDGNKV